MLKVAHKKQDTVKLVRTETHSFCSDIAKRKDYSSSIRNILLNNKYFSKHELNQFQIVLLFINHKLWYLSGTSSIITVIFLNPRKVVITNGVSTGVAKVTTTFSHTKKNSFKNKFLECLN